MRQWLHRLAPILLIATIGCYSDTATEDVLKDPAREDESTIARMNDDDTDDDWQQTWDDRLAVLEHEFGQSSDKIFTAMPPLYLRGGADVLTFKEHVDGVTYVTASLVGEGSGLVGEDSKEKTDLGDYELMMCVRSENEWTPSLLSRLAPHTFGATLNPGDTMDIAAAMPKNSTIAALLFVAYRKFRFNDTAAGALLCIGITEAELAHCREHGHDKFLETLQVTGVFPFTDPHRKSTIP